MSGLTSEHRSYFISELHKLSMIDFRDEINTITTFRNVIQGAIDTELLSREDLCRIFVITIEGLNKWMSRDEGNYSPPSVSRPRIYQLILENIMRRFAA